MICTPFHGLVLASTCNHNMSNSIIPTKNLHLSSISLLIINVFFTCYKNKYEFDLIWWVIILHTLICKIAQISQAQSCDIFKIMSTFWHK